MGWASGAHSGGGSGVRVDAGGDVVMVRERVIVIPVAPTTGGSAIGVIAPMVAVIGGAVLVAVAACTAITSADFGPGATIPTGDGCQPFCSVSATVPVPAPRIGGEQR